MNEATRGLSLSEQTPLEIIKAHIAEFREGGPYREGEDLELARRVALSEEAVKALWRVAQEEVEASVAPKREPVPVQKPRGIIIGAPKADATALLSNVGLEALPAVASSRTKR
jgi:hypothetical protein